MTVSTLLGGPDLRTIALLMADGQLQQADDHLLRHTRRNQKPSSQARRMRPDHLALALEHGQAALHWLKLAANQ